MADTNKEMTEIIRRMALSEGLTEGGVMKAVGEVAGKIGSQERMFERKMKFLEEQESRKRYMEDLEAVWGTLGFLSEKTGAFDQSASAKLDLFGEGGITKTPASQGWITKFLRQFPGIGQMFPYSSGQSLASPTPDIGTQSMDFLNFDPRSKRL